MAFPITHPTFPEPPLGIDTLIHEFNHVLQYQKLGFANFFLRYANEHKNYGLSKSGFDRNIVYEYGPRNSVYATETLEGQSQMAGDYAKLLALNAASSLPQRQKLERRLHGSGIYGL
ncbi:hypothetical protein GCM10009087_02710 [Sphingomonas oligophenolica]|uniref:DUF4157 domain-containing protein n=1 Tax=Sphingomonas oligophenolica TaxID=301154 RepID=A0ABU9Y0N5_9SPHN